MKVPSPLSPTSNDPVRLAGHPLFTPENLYRAYRQCRRRKRKTANAMAFERDLEANLLALREELNSGDYMPGRSLAFLVERPKRREIFAADFRDRVVHHLLVGHLEPAWERRFIHDSYACRKGKGTHKGVERLRSFLRRATCSNTRPAWYLQLDVRGFFVAIDRQVLYQRLQAKEHDPAVLWLIRRVLFTEPARHCRLRGCHRSAFESLPPHKTLFKARPGCGLPIGNLTSQFFANVYLDALDQFVKHTLKAQWYLRYCDDLVLVSRDRHQLEAWEQRNETFLGKELKLDLNERRRLRPVSDGIDFLGYITRPDYLLVRRRVVGALKERLYRAQRQLLQAGLSLDGDRRIYPWPKSLLEGLCQSLTAYLAHFARADSWHLIAHIRRRFPWLEAYFLWHQGQVRPRYPTPRYAANFRHQMAGLRKQLAGHLLLVQTGSFWRVDQGALSERERSGLPLLPEKFHQSGLPSLCRRIWDSTPAIAWVRETGCRTTTIAERVLSQRWEARTGLAPTDVNESLILNGVMMP